VDYDIGESASVGATMRYTNARYEYDDVVSGQKDDDNSVGRYREAFVTLFGECTIFEYWKQTIRLGWMEMIRQNFDDDPPATDYVSNKFSGRYFKLDYNSIFPVLDFDTVVVGYEYTEEIGDNYKDYGPAGGGVYDMPKAFSHENDLYVENRINVTDRLTSTQGIRISHHTKAGTFSTYRFDGSYLLATGTKIRGLIGTGYRAPSLFQLYTPRDPYMGAGGNASLKPEKSFSYEYGLDQYLFGDKVILGVTYFSAIYRDLIDAVETAPWVYDDYRNVGKATAHGIEISAKAKPYKGMTVTGGFTYQKTKNLQTDRELLLRPAHKFFIEYAWEVTDKFRVDTLVRYNGPNIDTDTKLSKIKEYTVVSFVAEYDITKNISVHCKIINLFNKHYEEAIGYSTLPFSAYGGVKAKF
jgi:vitamin B12 transporter